MNDAPLTREEELQLRPRVPSWFDDAVPGVRGFLPRRRALLFFPDHVGGGLVVSLSPPRVIRKEAVRW